MGRQSFDSEDVMIAYIDEGQGEPTLLIHGFASNVETNWINPGWVSTLTDAGRRVIAYDNRGHVTDSAACLARWAEASWQFYRRVEVYRDMQYGPAPSLVCFLP